MHVLRVFPAVLLLAFAGCGNKARPAQPTISTAECAGAAQNDARLLTASAPAGAEQLGVALERHCKDDGWTEDAQACIVTATDNQALEACDPLLTQAQKDAIGQEASALAAGGTGGATFGGATYGTATDGSTVGNGTPN